jgi:hypothetical protein
MMARSRILNSRIDRARVRLTALNRIDWLPIVKQIHLVEISQGFFGSVLPKVASTSSAFMRAEGSPGSFKFCSSVPSPIIPGWVILADLLGALAFGLFVTRISQRKCDDAAALSNDHVSSKRAFQVRVGNYSVRIASGTPSSRAENSPDTAPVISPLRQATIEPSRYLRKQHSGLQLCRELWIGHS